MIFLRTQAEFLADIEARLRDTANAKWTDAEIYRAINDALRQWDGRISCPVVYVSSTNWPATNFGIDLPDWIDDARLRLQQNVDSSYDKWLDLAGWTITPNADGTRRLQLAFVPQEPYRIVYWTANGQLPTTVPTLSSGITATDTSLTVNQALDVAPAGWVKIGAEWLSYAGLTVATATTTLTNLTRAQNNTAAATHDAAASVAWGIGTTARNAYAQLLDQTRAYLHELALQNAASTDRPYHESMVSYYQTRADEFWKRWAPVYSPRLNLTWADPETYSTDYNHEWSGPYRDRGL